uniref:Uncharacterized protein n=1 Tax=viral metagenome TaxID=1070528 RepID=A0A6M3KA63_9ZZZZ
MIQAIQNPICFCGKRIELPNLPLLLFFSGYIFCPDCNKLTKANANILNIIKEYNVPKYASK